MTNYIEDLFRCLLTFPKSSSLSVQILCPHLSWVIVMFYWVVLRVLYVFLCKCLVSFMTSWYFLPICALSFHTDGVLCSTQDLHFDEVRVILLLVLLVSYLKNMAIKVSAASIKYSTWGHYRFNSSVGTVLIWHFFIYCFYGKMYSGFGIIYQVADSLVRFKKRKK